MRPLVAFTTLALTVTVLAGCIGDQDTLDTLPTLDGLDEVIELTHVGHEDGHTLAELHALASDNMRQVAFHSLAHDDIDFNDGNAEVTVLGDYAYVATLGATSGFVIVDITDPAAPEVVGRYSNPNVYSPDVKVSDDGNWAFLSSHPGTTLNSYLPPEANVLPTRFPDALAYGEEGHATGVTLVDISDKTSPVMVDFYAAEPDGTHNTEYANINGRDIVFAVDRNKVTVLEIQDTPAGTKLVPIGDMLADDYFRDELPGRVGSASMGAYLPPGSHDVVYQQHPITQDHLAYVPFGVAGFYIFNVNDPANPSMVSNWRGLPEGNTYYHYARPADIQIDDYHITVVAPEIFAGEVTGTFAILDTTDPNEPVLLGEWQIPGEDLLIEANYRFSPHNYDIVDGKLYIANYHAGVWVVDLTCKGCLEEPRADGYFLPAEETDRIEGGEIQCAFWCERPMVWGVVVGDDGLLYASDVESGLYVIEYTPGFYAVE